MAVSRIPHFGDPQGVALARILRDNVAEAAGHGIGAAEDNRRQRVAIPRGRHHLADQSIHAPILSQRLSPAARLIGRERRRIESAVMEYSRRQFLGTIATAPVAFSLRADAQSTNADVVYGATTIPLGIRSRLVPNINGITMHALEAGYDGTRPAVLLLHGFPELAYSWRHVMLPLAKAGYHVIAPDLRGYGRSGGTDVKFDDDLTPFSTLNRVRDMLSLINALGHRNVQLVAGHDFGSPVAGWCALTRPDVFRSVVMMSAPFGGGAPLPFNTANEPPKPAPPAPNADEELAKLTPPRKHYQTYYTTREANENMWHPAQGVHDFLRAYYHMKSADWAAN